MLRLKSRLSPGSQASPLAGERWPMPLIGAAIDVHRELGCGFHEPVYRAALAAQAHAIRQVDLRYTTGFAVEGHQDGGRSRVAHAERRRLLRHDLTTVPGAGIGEPQAGARIAMLYVQSRAHRELDYPRLLAWLEAATCAL